MIWHAQVHNLWQILNISGSGASCDGSQNCCHMSNAHTKQWITYSIKYLVDFPSSTKLFIRGNILITGDAQTLQTRWLWGLNFVQQCLTFVDPQYGTCSMSPFWHLKFWGGSLGVSSPLFILELSGLTRIGKAVKKRNYICNIQDVSVYTNVSAKYMFRPLLVRPSSGWIP